VAWLVMVAVQLWRQALQARQASAAARH